MTSIRRSTIIFLLWKNNRLISLQIWIFSHPYFNEPSFFYPNSNPLLYKHKLKAECRELCNSKVIRLEISGHINMIILQGFSLRLRRIQFNIHKIHYLSHPTISYHSNSTYQQEILLILSHFSFFQSHLLSGIFLIPADFPLFSVFIFDGTFYWSEIINLISPPIFSFILLVLRTFFDGAGRQFHLLCQVWKQSWYKINIWNCGKIKDIKQKENVKTQL